jgi:hypothetical protein
MRTDPVRILRKMAGPRQTADELSQNPCDESHENDPKPVILDRTYKRRGYAGVLSTTGPLAAAADCLDIYALGILASIVTVRYSVHLDLNQMDYKFGESQTDRLQKSC